MESENTYHWKRRNMDKHHQFYPIFWGAGVFFFHWTILRYLLCPVALQPGCRWNPGRLTGLVQCHEAYELQIGSLVEKTYPSNSFSKGVLLGRCLAEQTGQLSPTILLWALLRFAAAVDQDPAMSLRTLPARFAPMQSAAQAEWLLLDYSVEMAGHTHSLP